MQSDTQVLLQVHSITKQIEYKGTVVELTETISHLPAGSQLLFSSATFERMFGRLHEIRLPADLTKSRCSRREVSPSKVLEVGSERHGNMSALPGKRRPEAEAPRGIVQSLPLLAPTERAFCRACW